MFRRPRAKHGRSAADELPRSVSPTSGIGIGRSFLSGCAERGGATAYSVIVCHKSLGVGRISRCAAASRRTSAPAVAYGF